MKNNAKVFWLDYLLAVFCSVGVLAADRLTKLYFASHFVLGESAPFLKGVLDFVYVRNSGGAWGLLSGKTYILLPVTAAVMALCIAALIKFAKSSRLLLWAIFMVLAGGLGNMFDRLFYGGEVVDFLHFEFFPSFPVFNVADCAVVAGAGLLILYFLLDSFHHSKPVQEDPHEDS